MNTAIPNFDSNADFVNEEYVRENFDSKIAGVDDPNFFRLLIALWRYLNDSPHQRDLLLVLFGLGYFIFPLDVVPDAIPFMGWTDDAAIVSAIVAYLGHRLHPYLG